MDVNSAHSTAVESVDSATGSARRGWRVPIVLGLLFAIQGSINLCLFLAVSDSLLALGEWHQYLMGMLSGVIAAQPVLLACAAAFGSRRWQIGAPIGFVLMVVLTQFLNFGVATVEEGFGTAEVYLFPMAYLFVLGPNLLVRRWRQWRICDRDGMPVGGRFQFTLGRLMAMSALAAALCAVVRWSYAPMTMPDSISGWLEMLLQLVPACGYLTLVSLGGLPSLVGILAPGQPVWRRPLLCCLGVGWSMGTLLYLHGQTPFWKDASALSAVLAGAYGSCYGNLLIVRLLGFRLLRLDLAAMREVISADIGDVTAFSPVASATAAML